MLISMPLFMIHDDYINVLITDLPGSPSAPDVSDVLCDSCTLTWRPPENDGGTPITGYYVERSSGTRSV